MGTPTVAAAPDIAAALTVEQLFDAVALRVDGPRSWSADITIDWHVTDEDLVHRVHLSNGLLVHFDIDGDLPAADATFTLTGAALHVALLGGRDISRWSPTVRSASPVIRRCWPNWSVPGQPGSGLRHRDPVGPVAALAGIGQVRAAASWLLRC